MKDISLEQYNLYKFGSITGKKTVAEEVKEVAENIDICKDVEEVKQFLENSNINKTKSIFRELTDEQVEELMRAEEEDFNFVSEANEIAEETITATESKTLTPDNSPTNLSANKTYNVKLTYGNHTYNYDVTTGATDVQIKYFTTDGALGITGDNVKVKPSSDNEKNNIRFDGSNNKLDLSTAGTTNIINNIRYYKTFEGGSSISKDEDTPLVADLTLERGQAEQTLTVTNEEKTVLLTNPFTGSNYTYKVKLKSGQTTNQTVKFEFLENSRLVITGNYIEVTAGDNQMDDIILLGNYNIVNTGDLDDNIRVGCTIDKKRYYYISDTEGGNSYLKNYNEEYIYRSVGNEINTGNGNDYLLLLAKNYKINMGDGNDKMKLYYTPNYDITNINGVESIYQRYFTNELHIIMQTGNEVDGTVNWSMQDRAVCRFSAFIDSLCLVGNRRISDFVDIVYNTASDDYTVTFKKNNIDQVNTTTVTREQINEKVYDSADMDVNIINIAINNLYPRTLEQDGTDPVMARYILGVSDRAYFWRQINKLEVLWDMYINGEISNITVGSKSESQIEGTAGAQEFASRQSIEQNHAYCVKNVNKEEKAIELINPWDSADSIWISYDNFLKYFHAICVYGENTEELELRIQEKLNS